MTGTLSIPQAEETIPATEAEALDGAVRDVSKQKDAWRAVSVDERIALLDRLIDATMAVAADWSLAAQIAKGINRDSNSRGEDAFSGPLIVLRNLRLLRESLESFRDTGSTGHGETRQLHNGQLAVKVFPTSALDNVLFPGYGAEVWMEHGVTDENLQDTVAVAYKEAGPRPGKVSAVLGAGNVSSIGPMDALYKLFVEDEVVVLKMNPVNAYTGPFIEQAFGPLIERDVLRVVYGGAEVGKQLTSHEDVDTLHITGSDKTYEAIVFGVGEEGARNKAADTPINDRHFTSELGNVTPIIVVPGRWTDKDIAFQAENIASMLVHNGGFNCIAGRVIVTHERWAQREQLIDAVRDALSRAEPRTPYYPGARDRWASFVAEHPRAETFGPDGAGCVPWTLIADLDETNVDDICFTTEAFCGVFGEVGLNAPNDVGAFLRQAVLFCNDTLWGTLSASIIIDPATEKANAADLEQTLMNLRYGSIVVNHFAGVAYAMTSPTWGAFPGHTRQDIQSGTGVVHNTYLFDRAEKSICRGPFRVPMKPIWFFSHKTVGDLGPALWRLEGKGDLTAMPELLTKAPLG